MKNQLVVSEESELQVQECRNHGLPVFVLLKDAAGKHEHRVRLLAALQSMVSAFVDVDDVIAEHDGSF
jgi:hypothetical protein